MLLRDVKKNSYVFVEGLHMKEVHCPQKGILRLGYSVRWLEEFDTRTAVTMLHSIDDGSYFIDAWDLTNESETAEKLREIITKSTEIVKERNCQRKVNMYTVVSDNASAVVKIGSLLKH
nr:unnamed protein product [Callosobruchus analis]